MKIAALYQAKLTGVSLEANTEIIIRKAIAAKLINISDAGFVIPAPVYFADKSDFNVQINSLVLDTQKGIETSSLAFCAISLLKFEDSAKEGCGDEPLVRLTYSFYFFREMEITRTGETLAPDDFLKTTLLSYNKFIKTVLDVRNEFLGFQSVQDLPQGFFADTNSITQSEFISDLQLCKFVPGVKGHVVNLQLVVELLMSE